MAGEEERLDPQDVVVAGSAGFVDAVAQVLADRLGGAPHVATTPDSVASLRAGGARMLVYEHDGQPWLVAFGPASGEETVVVAALPPEQAGAVGEISRSVTAVVAWHGEGRPVLDAVARILAAREAALPAVVVPRRPFPPPPARTEAARAEPARTPEPPAAPPSPPAPALEPLDLVLPEPTSLDSIFEGAVEEVVEAEEPTLPVPPPAVAVPAVAATATWPGSVPPPSEGLAMVRAALGGSFPREELRAVTTRVLASLSSAERDATAGTPLPFDAAPVRRAVGLRWQVAAAIASLPPAGADVDAAATQAILIGIDEVLAALKEVGAASGAPVQRELEPVRNGLVREAIDLTEALAQVAPAAMVEEITATRKMAPSAAAAPAPRLDEVRTFRPPRPREAEARGFSWALVVVLTLAALAAAAYHGYRYVNRGQAPSPLAGAPSGTVGLVTPQGKFVLAPAGVRLDPREVENFRALERAKGNEVRELAPGVFVAAPPAAGGAP